MGRVIDDGGVFAPRLEVKRIQQGRIPFRERLAEKYLSPTGVAQTMKNVGQIASLLGEIEFDPMKQKTGQDAAKSVAQKRIGGELPEGMTRVGMATGQGAPSATGRDAGRELIMRGRDSTLAGVSGLPAGIPEANLGVMTDFAQGLEAAPPLSELSPGLETDPESYRISQMAADASRQMRSIGGIPTKMAPGGDQQTYMLQVDAVNRGLLTPQEFAASPGVTRRGTRQHAVVERLRSEFGGTPVAKMERVMPTQEEYEASQRQPEPAQAPSAPVPEAMEPEPYVPTDRPAEPAAAPAAAAPVAAPVAPAAAPVAPAMTQRQRIRKVLADISSPTYEGQQNALRAMAMQADTAEAQSAIMNALSEVRIPSRGIRDLFRPQSRRAAFREEIRRLFPGVKKPPAPMTEKERLGLEMQRKRLELAEKQLEAAEERRADEREERKRQANEREQKSKTGKRRRALRAGRGTGGKKHTDDVLKLEIVENNKQLSKRDPTVTQYKQDVGRAKSALTSLRSQEKRLQTPLKKTYRGYPKQAPRESPTRFARREREYKAAKAAWKTADGERKEQLEAVQKKIREVNKTVKGYEKAINDVQSSYKRQKLYQTALNRLRNRGRGQRMTAEQYEDYADRILSINMGDETNEEKIKSFRVVLDELAGKKPEAQAQRQGGDEGTKNRNLTTLQRQLSSIEDDIKTSKFTVTVDPAQDNMGRQGVTVKGNISQELKNKIIRAVRGGRYLGNKIITLPVGGN